MTIVYDAGVLVAADRNDREAWAKHRARLERDVVPITTAPVVAQVSRSVRQALLHRFLRGCDVVAFAPADAHEVGALLGRAGTADAHVVVTAARRASAVLTTDRADLEHLSSQLPAPVLILGL